MAAIACPVAARPSRRRFLAGAASFIPLAYLAGCATGFRPSTTPFTLGVASGEPRSDGVVLWTRLAPDPLAGGGMPSEPVEVAWSVAEDERFTRIVRRGTEAALPQDAHSVHVALNGLQPARHYWYRFVAGGYSSPIGRTRTAPAADDNGPVRFAFASCQQYEQGYYAAHRHLAAEEIDVVFFLGDYIYETSWGRDLIRTHGTGETFTLGDYRNRYALYKSDTDLQSCHAAHPWIVTWDDHEVSNDYAADRGERAVGTDFLARRAAAYKAYWEHMPLNPGLRPGGNGLRLYRSLDYGTMARFAVLDDRQYRSHQPCTRPGYVGGAGIFPEAGCTARLDPRLSLLGETQERWLMDRLDRSPARWNMIVQQTRMAQFDLRAGPERRFLTDGWDGYHAARRRLLDFVGTRQPRNTVVLGGDVHTTVVSELKADFDDPRSPAVASEICSTSISSYGPANRQALARLVSENPHVRYANGWTRGYVRMELGGREAMAELHGLADAKRRDSTIATIARFTIEDGRAGPHMA